MVLSSKIPKEARRAQYAMFSEANDPIFTSKELSLGAVIILNYFINFLFKRFFKLKEWNKLACLRVPGLDPNCINFFSLARQNQK